MNLLIISIFSLFLAQFLKIFTQKPFSFSRIIGSGGMPSSHSAFVSTLTTIIGLKYGFQSDLLAVVAVFSLIIIYDASGVRRAVGKQANVINNIIQHLDIKKLDQEKDFLKEELRELIGHAPYEVLAGVILGILIGCLYWYI